MQWWTGTEPQLWLHSKSLTVSKWWFLQGLLLPGLNWNILTSEEWRLRRTHRLSSCLGRRGTHPVWCKEVWFEGQDSPGEPLGTMSTSFAVSAVLLYPPSKEREWEKLIQCCIKRTFIYLVFYIIKCNQIFIGKVLFYGQIIFQILSIYFSKEAKVSANRIRKWILLLYKNIKSRLNNLIIFNL